MTVTNESLAYVICVIWWRLSIRPAAKSRLRGGGPRKLMYLLCTRVPQNGSRTVDDLLKYFLFGAGLIDSSFARRYEKPYITFNGRRSLTRRAVGRANRCEPSRNVSNADCPLRRQIVGFAPKGICLYTQPDL